MFYTISFLYHENSTGSFSVKSLFHVLVGEFASPSPFADIWKLKVPPRVVAFAWFALSRCILTMDNLRKRKIILVNGCPCVLRKWSLWIIGCHPVYAVFHWFGLMLGDAFFPCFLIPSLGVFSGPSQR